MEKEAFKCMQDLFHGNQLNGISYFFRKLRNEFLVFDRILFPNQ